MKIPSVEFYLQSIHDSASNSGLKFNDTGKRAIVSNAQFLDKDDPWLEKAEFEEVVIQPLTPEKFNHLHKVLFTDPPKDTPRFYFDPETKYWVLHEEIANKIPKLVNPDYVDCQPNEIWIDLITGEVKETPITQTASPTPSKTE